MVKASSVAEIQAAASELEKSIRALRILVASGIHGKAWTVAVERQRVAELNWNALNARASSSETESELAD